MAITRRAALQTMIAAGVTAAGARRASAAVLPTPPADAVGLGCEYLVEVCGHRG